MTYDVNSNNGGLTKLAAWLRRKGFRVVDHPAFSETYSGSRNSYHGGRFSQDYHDENGRLIHAEWDGYFWQLQDAKTGEFLGLWDKPDLPAQPGELVFRAPFVKMEDRFRDE